MAQNLAFKPLPQTDRTRLLIRPWSRYFYLHFLFSNNPPPIRYAYMTLKVTYCRIQLQKVTDYRIQFLKKSKNGNKGSTSREVSSTSKTHNVWFLDLPNPVIRALFRTKQQPMIMMHHLN